MSRIMHLWRFFYFHKSYDIFHAILFYFNDFPSSQEIIRRYKHCRSVVQTEYSSNVDYLDARSQLCNMVGICCNEKWVTIISKIINKLWTCMCCRLIERIYNSEMNYFLFQSYVADAMMRRKTSTGWTHILQWARISIYSLRWTSSL